MWAYIGDADYPYVLFDFTSDYTADAPTRFLTGYKGYLQADALAQYEGLYGEDKVKHVCCVAHARRKFVAASDAGDERAANALELFGRLYAIERALPPLLPPSDDPVQREQRRQHEEQRRQLRQRDAGPVWDELSKWVGKQKPHALPKSPLGTAIGYASNNWDALKRYLERGFLALDNVIAPYYTSYVGWRVLGSYLTSGSALLRSVRARWEWGLRRASACDRRGRRGGNRPGATAARCFPRSPSAA